MGPGDDLFSHFGHSAICVGWPERPSGVCYNYGTADFSTPLPLTIDFIRGRARFWVSAVDRERMVAAYRREDRSLWRQRLPLDPEQARELATALDRAVSSDERYYRYHHFLDNCTTRIRDLVDRVTRRGLSRGAASSAALPNFRAYTLRGFAGHAPLLAVSDLVLGRAADQPITEWQAMFLPEVTMAALEEQLGAEPVLEYERRGPPPEGSPWLGRIAFFVIGAGLAALLLLARRRPRLQASLRIVTALVLGLVALLPWTLAIVSEFPELRHNEVLLVLWPFDLLLVFLGAGKARRYLEVRLGALALVLVAWVAGVLIQPLWALMLLCAPPLVVLWWRARAAAQRQLPSARRP